LAVIGVVETVLGSPEAWSVFRRGSTSDDVLAKIPLDVLAKAKQAAREAKAGELPDRYLTPEQITDATIAELRSILRDARPLTEPS
jgi:hypothetical protein